MPADPHIKAAVALIAAVTVGWALYVASAVFAPAALALFIIALVWPLQSALQERMPKLLALTISVLVTIVVFLALTTLAGWAFGRVARWLVSDTARFQSFYDQIATWLEGHGMSIATLWTEHFNTAWMIRRVQEVTGRLNTTLSFWLIALVYVILGLLEVDDIRAKIAVMSNRNISEILREGSRATAIKFRKYMIVRTQMSIATGVLVWLFAWAVGLQFAAEWGVIAFVLNYIPFIGPFIATMFPTLFAVATFGTWQAVLLIFLCLNLIQFVVGSYVEPRVSGTVLSMSPTIVLFAVFFWAFMWGIFGAFIGVPITIAILTFCAQSPSTKWMAELLGGPMRTKQADNT
jgi:AI-2 transport protein TqsA